MLTVQLFSDNLLKYLKAELVALACCLQSCMTQETPERGQVQHIEELAGELVVVGGNGSVDRGVTDQAFNAIALPVEALVPAHRRVAVRARWDHGGNSRLVETAADGIAVVALVGDQVTGPRFGERGDRFELRAVGRLIACEVETEWQAGGITEIMNFTREPANPPRERPNAWSRVPLLRQRPMRGPGPSWNRCCDGDCLPSLGPEI